MEKTEWGRVSYSLEKPSRIHLWCHYDTRFWEDAWVDQPSSVICNPIIPEFSPVDHQNCTGTLRGPLSLGRLVMYQQTTDIYGHRVWCHVKHHYMASNMEGVCSGKRPWGWLQSRAQLCFTTQSILLYMHSIFSNILFVFTLAVIFYFVLQKRDNWLYCLLTKKIQKLLQNTDTT